MTAAIWNAVNETGPENELNTIYNWLIADSNYKIAIPNCQLFLNISIKFKNMNTFTSYIFKLLCNKMFFVQLAIIIYVEINLIWIYE